MEKFFIDKGHTVDFVTDYGTDGVVNTFDENGFAEGGDIRLQLKASDNLHYSKDGTHVSLKTRKLKYGDIRKVLVELGFSEQTTKSNHLVYHHPGSRLPIFLPRMRASANVEPVKILSLRNALENAGFWDSLVRQTGTESPAQAIHVLKTLAGIKNGKNGGHKDG